jgi:hypothetical protein
MAQRSLRKRFWLEIGCGVLGGALFVLTLISKEWIEEIFGVDPDRGSGALEWGITFGLLGVAAVSFILAHREFRRPAVT